MQAWSCLQRQRGWRNDHEGMLVPGVLQQNARSGCECGRSLCQGHTRDLPTGKQWDYTLKFAIQQPQSRLVTASGCTSIVCCVHRQL